jgi:hypothetical protein
MIFTLNTSNMGHTNAGKGVAIIETKDKTLWGQVTDWGYMFPEMRNTAPHWGVFKNIACLQKETTRIGAQLTFIGAT